MDTVSCEPPLHLARRRVVSTRIFASSVILSASLTPASVVLYIFCQFLVAVAKLSVVYKILLFTVAVFFGVAPSYLFRVRVKTFAGSTSSVFCALSYGLGILLAQIYTQPYSQLSPLLALSVSKIQSLHSLHSLSLNATYELKLRKHVRDKQH